MDHVTCNFGFCLLCHKIKFKLIINITVTMIFLIPITTKFYNSSIEPIKIPLLKNTHFFILVEKFCLPNL